MSDELPASVDYQSALRDIRADPSIGLGRGTGDPMIAAAEATLGAEFPPEFKAYLRDLNGGWLGDRPYTGIRGDDPRLDLVARTLEARTSHGIDRRYVLLSDDGGDHLIVVLCDPNSPLNGQIDSIAARDGSIEPFATNVGELLQLDLDQR